MSPSLMCEIEIVVRSAPSEQLGDVPVKQYGDMQRVWYVSMSVHTYIHKSIRSAHQFQFRIQQSNETPLRVLNKSPFPSFIASLSALSLPPTLCGVLRGHVSFAWRSRDLRVSFAKSAWRDTVCHREIGTG